MLCSRQATSGGKNQRRFILWIFFYDRVTELLDEYRLKLTGSLESKKESRVFGFIYKDQSGYQTEILDFVYKKAYEDGRKNVLQLT
jgi:hypothetical protein